MSALSGKEIEELLSTVPPLIEGYAELKTQLQNNGFDMSLRDITMFQNIGQISADNSGRRLPDLAQLIFGTDGFIELLPGSYMITYNEIVNLPKNVMALARPRSSLLRCGVDIGTAVWDAGYSGRSQSLLVVHNPYGFRIQKGARVAQMVFFRLDAETKGYSGRYQGENIT